MNTVFIIMVFGIIAFLAERKYIKASSDRMRMLTEVTLADMQPRAIEAPAYPKDAYIINRYTSMSSARVVRSQEGFITVIYARDDGIADRIKFETNETSGDVREGDPGILIITETGIPDSEPSCRFIRDSDRPTVDDVLELGTGDDLTDRIFLASVEHQRNCGSIPVIYNNDDVPSCNA